MCPERLDGLWPVMITPFLPGGEIDYASLERLIAWYEAHGVSGLFAACQSSEIFQLDLREREELVRFVKNHAHVPVIASGHVSDSLADQVDELTRMRNAGADALILITNRLARAGDPEGAFIDNLRALMAELPGDAPLGFYECPYPYKRLIAADELKWCADSGRFLFIKDTCCDIELIKKRIEIIKGSPLRLFNANTSTLLQSLEAGAAGFSGVMLNFHPDLYKWLLDNWRTDAECARAVQAFLTAFSFIESQAYPVNAKYFLQTQGVLADVHTRVKKASLLTGTGRDEVRQMAQAARAVYDRYCR